MIKNAEIPGVRRGSIRGVPERGKRAKAGGVPLEILGIAYLIVMMAVGVILVAQPARVTQANARLGKLEAELHELRLRNENLKKTVAFMESLTFVESEARYKLGMVDPCEVRTFSIPAETYVACSDVDGIAGEDIEEVGGIRSLIARIAGIFGTREVIAKGGR